MYISKSARTECKESRTGGAIRVQQCQRSCCHEAMGTERGSRVQQRIQPRQTDGVSSLLELGVVKEE